MVKMTTEAYTNDNLDGEYLTIIIDHDRDRNLTEFGKATLRDRYLQKGEHFQDLYARVATYFADDKDHAQRLYDYMSSNWFMPSTPILSNGGTDRGLPISCFLNTVDDSLDDIDRVFSENIFLAARGGGIGTNWNNVRSRGEKIRDVGTSSGVIPFLKMMDSQTLGISQGSLRRGSAAVYMDIDHPEIEEFIEVRKPEGDVNRQCLNIHHGVTITDAFMEAVSKNELWFLRERTTGDIKKTVSARDLFRRILDTRMQTGEPYILFKDTVNKARPEHHKRLGLEVSQSNLCSEITLPTNADRTAVCCLSSLNAEYFDLWKDTGIVEDVLRMLDNVLTDFINRASDMKGFERAVESAENERSVGLGMMGFHSLLQSKSIPFGSVQAKQWNIKVFDHVRSKADAANRSVGEQKGSCPDAVASGANEPRRWSYTMAVAPTASISIICGGTSPGVDPVTANVFTQKTLSGSFEVRNKYLTELLMEKAEEITDGTAEMMQQFLDDMWGHIIADKGSVKSLTFLSDDEKAVFETAFEIDPAHQLTHMVDRAPFVDQAVSNNLFIAPHIPAKDLVAIHVNGWKRGVKSFYYLRTLADSRAATIKTTPAGDMPSAEQTVDEKKYEECSVCQ